MPKAKITNRVVKLVDEFGNAKASTAIAKEYESKLRSVLLLEGDGDYNGKHFRTTIRTTESESIPTDILLAKVASQMKVAAFKRWVRRNKVKTVKVTVTSSARVEGK